MPPSPLANDANLGPAPEVEGYKVLPPCVIYAKVGQGGMGAVYRGRHLNLDIDVAVKCLKPGLVADDDQFVVRFRREARAAARINHQNVIRVYDVAEDHGLHYLIMELVQGETARERVVRKQRLKVGEALEIVYEAAQGLAEAHRKGFIHRDIKPDNLMISSAGQVKVADLGLAKPTVREDAASLLSGTNVVMGTPQYMPPEQWESTSNVTAAADVWALGATLYYLLVGGEAIQKDSLPRIMQRIVMEPFPDVRKARPDVPDDVAALIERATQREPKQRFQDGQELADAIAQLATRRETLRDREAAPAGQTDPLLSPPPAKTLARIKVWLDENGQRGPSGTVVSPMADAATGPGGTQRMAPPAGGTVVQTPPRRGGRGIWLAAGLLAIAATAAVFVPWSRWLGDEPFAAAQRFAAEGRFAAAIAEIERGAERDPQLPGKAERLAELHAGWSRQLASAGDLGEALAQVERSLVLRADEEVRRQRQELLTRIAGVAASALVRLEPTAPLPAATVRATLRGRLPQPLVVAIVLQGRSVPLAAGGEFATEVELGGRRALACEAVLQGGQRVALPDWPIDYAAPVANVPEPANPANSADPGKPTKPTNDPGPVVPVPPITKAPAGGAEASDIELTFDRDRLELDDERPTMVTIRTTRGATLEIDGKRIERGESETAYVHTVKSSAEQPPPVVVVARLGGSREVRKEIAVTRPARALSFVKAPGFATDVERLSGDRLATAKDSLLLRGQLNESGETLLVDGRPTAADWREGGFVAKVDLALGTQTLRIEVQKRFRASAAKVVTVTRLGEPGLTVAGTGSEPQMTSSARFRVVAKADEWTSRVTVRRERDYGARGRQVVDQVELKAESGAPGQFAGEVPVEVGENMLVVEAVNCVGLKAERELRVQRAGASAPPVLGKVEIAVGGEVVPVEANRYVFLRSGGELRITSSDPAAELWLDGKVAEGAKGLTLALDPLLHEGERRRFEIKVHNGIGFSKPFVFGATLDTTPPEIVELSPKEPAPAGKDFICRGSWRDPNGLARVTVGGRPAELTPVTGIAPSGSWQVRVTAPADGSPIEVVVEDRAGNRTTASLAVAK